MSQLIAAECGVRVWFEFVESEANIADGPSRFGKAWVASPDATHLQSTMEDARLPDLSGLLSAPADSLRGVLGLLHAI